MSSSSSSSTGKRNKPSQDAAETSPDAVGQGKAEGNGDGKRQEEEEERATEEVAKTLLQAAKQVR
jgi:hypothetical protein